MEVGGGIEVEIDGTVVLVAAVRSSPTTTAVVVSVATAFMSVSETQLAQCLSVVLTVQAVT